MLAITTLLAFLPWATSLIIGQKHLADANPNPFTPDFDMFAVKTMWLLKVPAISIAVVDRDKTFTTVYYCPIIPMVDYELTGA